MDKAMRSAATHLAAARKVVVFTGAGVSKESGVATYRDGDEGLWANYDPMEMASLAGFLRDPELVWRWYVHRFGIITSAQPNPGHRAIAELERLLPQVVVVTQNVDGLHQAAGSRDVIELHGTMRRAKCLSDEHTGYLFEEIIADDEMPPLCPRCGGLLRPDVVWFGEALPHDDWQRAQQLTKACDVLLMAGTSAVVFPAAMLPGLALERGAAVIDVNTEPDPSPGVCRTYCAGPPVRCCPNWWLPCANGAVMTSSCQTDREIGSIARRETRHCAEPTAASLCRRHRWRTVPWWSARRTAWTPNPPAVTVTSTAGCTPSVWVT
jgi:NAD-dependent deacetylase